MFGNISKHLFSNMINYIKIQVYRSVENVAFGCEIITERKEEKRAWCSFNLASGTCDAMRLPYQHQKTDGNGKLQAPEETRKVD